MMTTPVPVTKPMPLRDPWTWRLPVLVNGVLVIGCLLGALLRVLG